MRIHTKLFVFFLFFSVMISAVSLSEFEFSDNRFQGVFTTENLDKIMIEYELSDGWYWTTAPNIPQSFHGQENAPGWTDTAVNLMHRTGYIPGIYGCRWMANKVFSETPGIGGYGECFGFAQFIGYLLSGEYNPHRNWNFYYNLEASDGLRVGDILRTDFTADGKQYRHSAVVYSVSEDKVLFIQVSGSTYNRIRAGSGFMDGYHHAPDTLEELAKIPNMKICRSQLNPDQTDTSDENPKK